MASYLVTNAGATDVNGTYTESGTYGGKPKYTNEHNVTLWWMDISTIWVFSPSPGVETFPAYYCATDAQDPELATWQVLALGSEPPPTVALLPGGAPFLPRLCLV